MNPLNVGPCYPFGMGIIRPKVRLVGGNLEVILDANDTKFHQGGEGFQIQERKWWSIIVVGNNIKFLPLLAQLRALPHY